ncbi:hypothetical protein CcI49_03225 [Frankia sp. CcI49]|uniref:hypothetical protein n=1 Tax=Frankia sp. CcI49 TaxID=1745382 RepID=UPI000977F60F|nr:hypothetical protein [Frankia sp. CcI49]ONH62405.1 hypothetical protein CcI49_03225 [Frankia sp. CcI49]
MSRYLPSLEVRFAATVADLKRRVAALELRTARVQSGQTLYPRYGTVDPGYAGGDPLVLVGGDATASGPYPYLRPYAPVAGDRVVLAPAGESYVVTGAVTDPTAIGVPALTGQRGSVVGTFPGGTNSLTVTVSFPAALPVAPSAAFVSGPLLDLAAPTFSVGAPTTMDFAFVVQRRDGANVSAGARTFWWLAVT